MDAAVRVLQVLELVPGNNFWEWTTFMGQSSDIVQRLLDNLNTIEIWRRWKDYSSLRTSVGNNLLIMLEMSTH